MVAVRVSRLSISSFGNFSDFFVERASKTDKQSRLIEKLFKWSLLFAWGLSALKCRLFFKYK